MIDRIKAFLDWLSRIMTEPLNELSRAQRTLRFLFDLGRYGARQLQHDRAPHMAGALAFRTLFGLLPVLVVGTVLVRAFRGFDDLRGRLEGLFTKLGLDRRAAPLHSLLGSLWISHLVELTFRIKGGFLFIAEGWLRRCPWST